ncbi:hypothetical protein MD484_g2007, partial [Candolleomyces efflorescens]
MASRPVKKVKEIVGDGEEIEVEDDGDLSTNDIDSIYKRAQHNDKVMGQMEPAETFALTLRSYQKQALLYCFPPDPSSDGVIDLTADEKPFFFNPYSGELSLVFPKAARSCRGGILADVGMGKTIMLSALIQTALPLESDIMEEYNRRKSAKQLRLNTSFKAVARKAGPSKPPSATLIVGPTSLLAQWAEELQRSSKKGTLDVIIWHGQNRLDLDAVTDEEGEEKAPLKVVITSYGTLASEHAKMDKYRTAIFEIDWLRVVLDEAHACKSRTSKTAKAVYALSARRRFITLPFLARDPKAIEIVQVILESILLRRDKNMRDAEGNRIVDLPPKEEVFEYLEFAPLERKIYDSIYVTAKRNFEQLDAKGLVGKNYTHILAMLMRLRRAVLHPNLVITQDDQRALSPKGDDVVEVNDLLQQLAGNVNESNKSSTFAESFLSNLAKDEVSECPICFGEIENPMLIPECMHQFCKDCIIAHIGISEERGQVPSCPNCATGHLQAKNLVEIIRTKREENEPSSSQPVEPAIVLRRNDFQSSTKLDALLQNLRRLKDQDPCFRAVVFSQFTSFLDLIQVALERDKFDHYRFDGTMDLKKKAAAISEFKAPSRRPKILVISLKAGGVGLNLTTANHVFMMDCWWNAATENQAVDRVHRIGQEKPVYVKHFIVSHTIEGRILQIQKRKTAIVNEAFKGSSKAAAILAQRSISLLRKSLPRIRGPSLSKLRIPIALKVMAPKANAFYAVRKGHEPGVYLTWSDCERQAKGYPNAKYKKFATRAEAEDFVRGVEPSVGAVAASEGKTNALAGPSRDTSNKRASTSTTTSSDRDVVYSDGACKGNGKPGSIAGIGVWWGPDDPRNIAERCPGDQTNNRAELIAILRVLEETPVAKRTLEIKTDSQYSIKCFQEWIRKWKNSGWKSAKNEPVKNVGIIRLIDAHLDRRARLGQPVLLSYVKGHSGDIGNDGADAQANLGATLPPVPERDWARDEELLKQDQAQTPEVPQQVIELAQGDAVLPVGSETRFPKDARERFSPTPCRNRGSVEIPFA